MPEGSAAAGAAVALDRSLAELERFDLNANVLGNRLNLQEGSLAQAGELLQRSAGVITMSRAMAVELFALTAQRVAGEVI